MYCENCGAELPPHSEACPVCGALTSSHEPTPSSTVTCPVCGNEVDNANLSRKGNALELTCPYCGAITNMGAVSQQAQTTSTAAPQNDAHSPQSSADYEYVIEEETIEPSNPHQVTPPPITARATRAHAAPTEEPPKKSLGCLDMAIIGFSVICIVSAIPLVFSSSFVGALLVILCFALLINSRLNR